MLQHYLVGGFIFLGMRLSVRTNKLDVPASLLGGVLALLIYVGAGLLGIVLLSAFFILGSVATSWRISDKVQILPDENVIGKRNMGQVFANSGLAAILGLLSFLFPVHQEVFTLMLCACFSSALSDTLSSELGNLYGKRFYNIISLKRDKKGLNGVVSVEGSLFGVIGSVLIALLYGMINGFSIDCVIIVLAGTLGNLSDSILGASLERKELLSNNGVNLFNTMVAALVTFILVSH